MTNSPAAGAVPAAVNALAEGVIQMMWFARPKPLVAVAGALILATAGVAVHGRQQAAPEAAPKQAKTPAPSTAGAGGAAALDIAANRDIAKQQLALIEQAQAAMSARSRTGELSLSDFSLWGRRKVETLRKSGARKAEIIAAIEKLIETLNQEEQIAEMRHKSARGTLLDVFDAQFRRMEAEIWLNEEKAR
jgi:hypothetical protein